jgi:hypothetical protein
MDVEGSEWELIDFLRERGVWPLIDEFFVEIHFAHPLMRGYGW